MPRNEVLPLSHILLVSQKVKDIRVPRNGQLEKSVGGLRRFLNTHGFISNVDKVPAAVTPPMHQRWHSICRHHRPVSF